jgi:DNA-binding NarL/FixJ family response regulator
MTVPPRWDTITYGVAVPVAVVEDHVLVREGIIATLEAAGGFQVVAATGNLMDFHKWWKARPATARPRLLLLDLLLEDGDADPNVVETLTGQGLKVLVVSGLTSTPLARAMLAAGVSGFVAKHDRSNDLVAAARAVAGGNDWMTPQLAQVLAQDARRPMLSDQEERALILYASDLKLEAVARELGVKPMTAKKYLDRVRAKYVALGRDVHTKTELYKAAVADGRVRPSSNQ